MWIADCVWHEDGEAAIDSGIKPYTQGIDQSTNDLTMKVRVLFVEGTAEVVVVDLSAINF
jgi:hypothetical protein